MLRPSFTLERTGTRDCFPATRHGCRGGGRPARPAGSRRHDVTGAGVAGGGGASPERGVVGVMAGRRGGRRGVAGAGAAASGGIGPKVGGRWGRGVVSDGPYRSRFVPSDNDPSFRLCLEGTPLHKRDLPSFVFRI